MLLKECVAFFFKGWRVHSFGTAQPLNVKAPHSFEMSGHTNLLTVETSQKMWILKFSSDLLNWNHSPKIRFQSKGGKIIYMRPYAIWSPFLGTICISHATNVLHLQLFILSHCLCYNLWNSWSVVVGTAFEKFWFCVESLITSISYFTSRWCLNSRF
jgi:hypothetical protein